MKVTRKEIMSLLTHMYKEELNVGKTCSFPTLFPIVFLSLTTSTSFLSMFLFFRNDLSTLLAT